MKCAWQELLAILPPWLSQQVDKGEGDDLQEIRLRLGRKPELIGKNGRQILSGCITEADLNHCINTASRYSPWNSGTISRGYLTAPGGHRIGVCGEAVMQHDEMTGLKKPCALCIRIARDYPGIADKAAIFPGSVLLLGPPGSGKTTLLRDLIRLRAKKEMVSVVDERGELFPGRYFDTGGADVLSGCPKSQGIEQLLRSMGPECIAVDEITAEADCAALLKAGWCGVSLLATAHAGSLADLMARPLYRPLAQSHLFNHILVMRRDKTWRMERMDL